jgi:hypothetical protein
LCDNPIAIGLMSVEASGAEPHELNRTSEREHLDGNGRRRKAHKCFSERALIGAA